MTEPQDLGLSHDLPILISRRRALGTLAGWSGSPDDRIALKLNVGV